jgi:hypothetical protein
LSSCLLLFIEALGGMRACTATGWCFAFRTQM